MIRSVLSIYRSYGTEIPCSICIRTDDTRLENTIYMDIGCIRPDILDRIDISLSNRIDIKKTDEIICTIDIEPRYNMDGVLYYRIVSITIHGIVYKNIRDYF